MTSAIKFLMAFLYAIPLALSGQVAGVFGGDVNTGTTSGKWIEFGEVTLNGNYNHGSMIIDFFPSMSPHGDSRQTVIVELRNGNGSLNTSYNDIVLITHYGKHFTVKDVKVIHTSGAGASNNKLSVWLQLGSSYVTNIPIEVRTAGMVMYHTTNQPFYTSIQDTGTTYDLTSYYGMFGSNFGIGTNAPSRTLELKGGDDVGIRLLNSGANYWEMINSNLGRLDFIRGGVNHLRIDQAGKIGVGTTSPSQKLDVNGIIAVGGQAALNSNANDILVGDLASGDGLRGLILRAGDQDRLWIENDGSVGIGTASPDQKLAVKGKIHAEEVIVDLSVPGPDYVFADNYPLTTLQEVEDFIQQNKHLPEVPTAKEMEQNGVELGTMNMLLLKKIEELTLYTLEQAKEIDKLKARSNSTLTPLLEERGEETSGLKGELETKIEELTLYFIEQQKVNMKLSKRIELLETKN